MVRVKMVPIWFLSIFPYDVWYDASLQKHEFINEYYRTSSVEELTERMKADGYEVISGPRTTGDGYYESCIVGIEGNLVEITV